MAKILVTGAAGFIGFHVSRRLLSRGDEVVGLDNLNSYYDVRLKEPRLAPLQRQHALSIRQLDLSDRDGMTGLFAGGRPARVVHLAAQAGVRYSLTNPHAYVDSNLTGFMNILEGCRHNGVEHLVYASSSSVYGANTNMPFSVHQHVDDREEGSRHTDEQTAPPNPEWSGARPDPATSRGPYRLYNIGNNNPVELMYLIETLEKALGKEAEKNMLPMQPGDVPATYADVEALIQDVGFKPATPIETGVKQFVAWYRAFY